MSSMPIADHALLSDCHSAAPVTRSGSVDWLCFPRFDSPSVLGRLLDDDAGHWSIAPFVPFESSRRYVDRSMVLETTFHTSSGRLVLTDALALGADSHEHQLGKGAPHLLIRRLECVEGELDVEIEYAPSTAWCHRCCQTSTAG